MSATLDQMLLNIFTTALEGGINYWSECNGYHWMISDGSPAEDVEGYVEDYKGFYANITNVVAEDEERYGKHYQINRNVVAKGYGLACGRHRNLLNWSSERPPVVVGPETEWDFDASDADMIVQLGLFEEVVYG
jgi:hypothetical protein